MSGRRQKAAFCAAFVLSLLATSAPADLFDLGAPKKGGLPGAGPAGGPAGGMDPIDSMPPSSPISRGKPLPGGNSGFANKIEKDFGIKAPSGINVTIKIPAKWTEADLRRMITRTAEEDARYTRRCMEKLGKDWKMTWMQRKAECQRETKEARHVQEPQDDGDMGNCTRVAVSDTDKDCGGGHTASRMTYSCPSAAKCQERTKKWTSEGNAVVESCHKSSGNDWLITVDFCR